MMEEDTTTMGGGTEDTCLESTTGSSNGDSHAKTLGISTLDVDRLPLGFDLEAWIGAMSDLTVRHIEHAEDESRACRM